jgi:hypothetical protein
VKTLVPLDEELVLSLPLDKRHDAVLCHQDWIRRQRLQDKRELRSLEMHIYNFRHAEEVKAKHKEYYQRHAEEIKAKNKEYRQRHKLLSYSEKLSRELLGVKK